MKKEGISDFKNVKPITIRKILRELNYNRYYEHIPQIIHHIGGVPSLTLTKEQEEKLRDMFVMIQEPFEQNRPKERKNFLSYSYVLYKFCEILGWNKFKDFFSLLKSKLKLYEQDLIWEKICLDLNWKFIPSQKYDKLSNEILTICNKLFLNIPDSFRDELDYDYLLKQFIGLIQNDILIIKNKIESDNSKIVNNEYLEYFQYIHPWYPKSKEDRDNQNIWDIANYL